MGAFGMSQARQPSRAKNVRERCVLDLVEVVEVVDVVVADRVVVVAVELNHRVVVVLAVVRLVVRHTNTLPVHRTDKMVVVVTVVKATGRR